MIGNESPAALARRLVLDARSLVKIALRSGMARAFGPLDLARLGRDMIAARRHGALTVVHAHALAEPDRPALVSGALRLSYSELDRRVNRLTHALVRIGIGSGDRVGLMLKNGHEFFELHLALSHLGALGVQLGYRLKGEEVAYIVGHAGLKALFFHPECAPAVDEARRKSHVLRAVATHPVPGFDDYETLLASGRDDAPHVGAAPQGWGGVMIYTSGTTGRGKGARRDFETMGLSAVFGLLASLPVTRDERHLAVAPLYHALSAFFVATVIGLGGCIVTVDHFDAEDTLALVGRERITSSLMVPTMLSRVLALPEATRSSYDTSSLRWIMSGAAPLPTETARGIEDCLGPILYNVYGATETGLVTLAGPGEHTSRPGTIGRAIQGNELSLVGEDGNEVPVGRVGELYVRSRLAMDGYHLDADATSAASRDGAISVGDLAYRDADGYYYLADRKIDMVISGGVNLYPWEIEQRLFEHPAVQDAAVIGVPDKEWGESLVAYVVLAHDHETDADTLRAFVGVTLADYKRPRRVFFVDELPRNPTGKILKRELRARYAEQSA
ncbi:MAG: AMP-binding protein [Polyangia bacterium]